jgi:hypothetical protein
MCDLAHKKNQMIDLFSFSVFNNLLLSCKLSSLERQDNLSNYKIIQIMAKEVSKEELYDAFGELIYAICCIDGEISIEEAKKIEEKLTGYEGAADMMWSFEYEYNNKKTVAESCNKALAVCQLYGACPDYPFLISTLKEIAAASGGISDHEKNLIDSFEKDLLSID